MTREELIEYLDMTLSQAADGPPVGPRPQGTFVGAAPIAALTGLRIACPDGTVLYLAVLQATDFETKGGCVMAHSPGPFKIVPEDIEHPNGRFRFIATADWDEDAGRGQVLAKLTDSPEIEGNAHLFAAAPDLYESARSAYFRLQQLEPDWARSDEMRALQAALDKATPPRKSVPRTTVEGVDWICTGNFDGNQCGSDADPGL